MTEQSTDQGGEAHDKPESASSAASDQLETTAKAGANLPAPHHATGQGSAEPARPASNIMILWPERPEASERVAFADDDEAEPRKARTSPYRRRRAAAMAAVIAVAALCGAAGGSLATFAFGHTSPPQAAVPEVKAATAEETALLRETVARLNTDLNAMKSDLDRTGKTRTTQISMLGERLNKVEKSQDETATRVAKIGDAQDKVQDKLRAASAAPAADVTGSIAAAKSKAPIVEGWTLTRVSNGAAVVDGPMGLYEAYPGDPLPGIGRVDAVRYQDGRWVVVTPKGLIVRR